MIIRRSNDSLLFIAQTDHAALSETLIGAWQADGLPDNPRRASILLATREHDNGWLEEDQLTHVDGHGEPLDFIAVPAAVKQRIWPRAAERLGATDPYAGALVAEHARRLFSQQDAEPVWRPFLARMRRVQDALLARCPADAAAHVAGDYRFVQAGDQLSLVFCNGWTSPFPRPGGRIQLRGDELLISPDPFDGSAIAFRVPARRVEARTFTASDDLRAAIDRAPIEYLHGVGRGTTPARA
jgi:hypothetical protein